jgi:hypothetical protein
VTKVRKNSVTVFRDYSSSGALIGIDFPQRELFEVLVVVEKLSLHLTKMKVVEKDNLS